MALENGEIRGPAGSGKVSAVARKDTSSVAAEILLHAKKWENQTLNLTGPEELSMEEIVALLSKETGKTIAYVDESVEEAYESRKNGQHKLGSMMPGSVPIQRLKLENKLEFQQMSKKS